MYVSLLVTIVIFQVINYYKVIYYETFGKNSPIFNIRNSKGSSPEPIE